MELHEQVKKYYLQHLDELPKDKQFHFCSRLAAWQADRVTLERLESLRDYMLPSQDPERIKEKLAEVMDDAANTNPYAKQLREPFFDKYPDLHGLHNAFFRIRHLKVIYGIDTRLEFLQLVSPQQLEDLYLSLAKDDEALMILSRFAIDYIFLYEQLFEKPRSFDPLKVIGLADKYDFADKRHVNLFVYLYTHCIIADSNFYVKKVPVNRQKTYIKMLEALDEFLQGRDDVKLDVLFEVLVANRICDRQSNLSEKINDAALQNYNPAAGFIIDPMNGDETAPLNSFTGSEHRNVLYIMSQFPYSPASS
jgi:hypothetical protein